MSRSVRDFAVSPTTRLILDGVRGLAAVAVFVGHFVNVFYVEDAGIENTALPVRALYSIEGFGLATSA